MALLVEEVLNFKRTGNPLSSMGLGGFSFDTLKPGAILISKRYFGVTEKTGKITTYHSGKLPIRTNNLLLVTEVRENAEGKTKNISFKRYGVELENVKVERQKLKDSGRKSLEWWGIPSGFFSDISKAKFDFRFDILVPGFNDIMESLNFERTGTPYEKLRIGRKTFLTLSPGDILKPKKDIYIGSRTQFSSNGGSKIWAESYAVVIKIAKTQLNNGLKIWYYQSWDLKQAKTVSENISLYLGYENSMTGSIKQFENRFEILQWPE